MGFLLEAMVWLNRRMPAAQLERRESDDAYSQWEYDTGRRIFAERFGDERARGKRMLDAVTANDSMEHFSDPGSALRELARVLRPGGRLFVTFPPYYSAWGAHLYDHVRLPLCRLMMSPGVLHGGGERAARDAEQARGGSDASGRARDRAREAIAFFETQLNRMSVRRFAALARSEPLLRLRRLVCVPLKFRALRALTSLPLIRELFTGLVVAELERVS